MDNGLLDIYSMDLLLLIDYIINWIFKISLVIIFIKLYDYLNWK